MLHPDNQNSRGNGVHASRRASAIRSPVPRGDPRGQEAWPPRLTALHPSRLPSGSAGTDGSNPGLIRRGNGEAWMEGSKGQRSRHRFTSRRRGEVDARRAAGEGEGLVRIGHRFTSACRERWGWVLCGAAVPMPHPHPPLVAPLRREGGHDVPHDPNGRAWRDRGGKGARSKSPSLRAARGGCGWGHASDGRARSAPSARSARSKSPSLRAARGGCGWGHASEGRARSHPSDRSTRSKPPSLRAARGGCGWGRSHHPNPQGTSP
jgi:hypothetical protein